VPATLPKPKPFVEVDWQNDAICRGMDPNLFYVKRGGSSRYARAVCARCPVVDACLEYAIANKETFGIWGGRSERERRMIRRERRLRVAS
jgi:WhiB family redox-sensing transcriptional regulator